MILQWLGDMCYLIKVESVEEKIILELFDARTTEVETGGDCCNVCKNPQNSSAKNGRLHIKSTGT